MRTSAAIKVIVLFITLALFVSAGHMRQQAINYDKMDKDLRIMENVLSAILMENESTLTAPSVKPRGAYIDGFGVVFIIPSIPRFVEVQSQENKVVIRNYIKVDRERIIEVAPRGAITEEAEVDTAKVQEQIIEFLGSYAGLIKQIKPDDWITVIANPSSSGYSVNIIRNKETQRVGGLYYTDLTDFPNSFIMSVKKEDITRYRTEVIDYDAFKNTVIISEIDDEQSGAGPAMQEDIKIMRGILESTVEDFFNTSLNSQAVQGMSVENFGVLFTINMDNYFPRRIIEIKKKEEGEDILEDEDINEIIELQQKLLQNELENAQRSMENMKGSLEIAEKSYEISRTRFNLGDTTGERLEKEKLRLEQAKENAETASQQYEKLNAELGQEREKLQEELKKMIDRIKVEQIEVEFEQIKEQIRAEIEQIKEQIEIEVEQQLVEKVDTKDIEKLKDVFIETLGEYGHTMRGLQSDDKIAVYLFTQSTRSKTLDEKTNMTIVAGFKDILDYNKGLISPDDFREKIKSRIF